MGVTGLWRLIEPAGKPVPVETLDNKVLAVDISIWLHQMVKGYQDAKGAPLPNAHLMGLFQRLCKLLYFRVKPVFVFDGGFPELKKETIAKRQDHKAKYNSESERIKRELAVLLSKKTAVSSLLGKQISPKKVISNVNNDDDMFKLPALPQRQESESESEEETSSGSIVDLHSVDMESDNFKNMPAKEKYDLLIELKETRKMNSWGKLHELPKKSDTFSDFQMQRLLKRRKVQECLEETEKEIGDRGMSLIELESLLNEEGIDTKIDALPTKRIASNETTRFLLIKDVKQALAEARKKGEENKLAVNQMENKDVTTDVTPKVDELEDDLQKAIKMSLECVDDSNVAASTSKTDDSWTSCMTDSDDEYSYDSEEDDGFEQSDNFATAKAYIMQYSDFTHQAIDSMMTKKKENKYKHTVPKVDQILDEINNEKSVIVDNVELSSDEDCSEDLSGSQIIDVSQSSETSSHADNPKSPFTYGFNSTQASVVCVENQPDIISLDTSTEETVKDIENCKTIKSEPSDDEFETVCEVQDEVVITNKQHIRSVAITSTNAKNDSDSSDNDFEDVPEIGNKSNTAIVQLTLNMGDAVDDDIFADIFHDKNLSAIDSCRKNNAIPESETLQNNIENEINIEDTEEMKINKEVDNIEPQLNKYVTTNTKPVDNLPIESSNKQNINIKPSQSQGLSAINTTRNETVTDTSDEIINIENNQSVESNKVKEANSSKQSEVTNTEATVQNAPKEILNTEKLTSLVEEIENNEERLFQEKGRLDRIGRNITEQMTKEAQELLQIFGIPYIVAPMEAEAQCAFLESVNLTDGTITDDSDIWLFGGRTVYKNFFNQKKHVLQFLAERIEKSFNLSREQLVLLALLVGSDYTTGLTGVGPVTALEILSSFPFNKKLLSETSKESKYTQIVKGLQEFKQWVRAGKRTDNTSLKKKLKNVNLTDDFPSVRVVQAYLEPNVEKNEDKFTWGELDITILRDYTKSKFGWSQNKLDEIIKPVLNRLRDRKTQRTVQDFFKRKVEFQSLEDQMSKRVKAAVQKMGPERPLESEDIEFVKDDKGRKRKSGIGKGDAANILKAGPSAKQRRETEGAVLNNHGVKVVSEIKDGKSQLEIQITKSDRYQEIIPQRERDKHSLLQNKMKAIELFRKTNIDKRKKTFKKKAILPKEKAELSESDSD